MTPITHRSGTHLVGALALAVGSAVLLGWALDVAALKSILPGWVSMKPNTAVAFILTGVSLLTFPPPAARRPPLLSRLSRICALFAGLIGLLTLGEYVFGWNPGFDQWLFREAAGTVGTSYPGRMAPDSALCFVMLAAGMEATRALRQRNRLLTGTVLLGGLVVTVALAAISTYFTPGFGAFGWWGLTNMALPTAALFAVLGGALIAVAWQTGDLNWSLGRKTTAAYAGGLTLVVLLGIHTSRSALWQAETARRVMLGEQVSDAISDVLAEAAMAQIHTRGYVITSGDRYLQSQQAESGHCRAKLAVLRQLVVDPAQQARSARLEAQVNELLQWYPQVIAADRTGSAATVRRDMVNQGEDLMDGVRALIVEMEAAEQRMLEEHHRQAQDVARFTQVIITTGTLVSLIVFLSVLWGLNQSEKRRQQVLATLSASKVQYRELFESSADALLLIASETGQIMDANPMAGVLYGYERDELLTKLSTDLSAEPEETRHRIQEAQLKPGQVFNIPLRLHRKKNGTVFPVEITARSLIRAGQSVLLIDCRDITEQKRAAAELQEQLDELCRWQAVMLGTADRSMKLKREVNDLLRRLGEPVRYPSQEP